MAERDRVEIEIRALTEQLKSDVAKAKSTLKSFSTEAKSSLSSAFNLKSILAGAGFYFGAREIIKFARESVNAFAYQEQEISRLKTALESIGYGEAVGSLVDYASALQKVTRFGDETTISMMRLLATYGMAPSQIKETIVAAMDLATAKGIEFRTAVDLLGKAFVGYTGTLARYGIILEKGLSKQEAFRRTLEYIRKNMGGAAQKDISSYAGKVAQLSNAWGDFKEKIGKGLVPVLTKAIGLANKLVDALNPDISYRESKFKEYLDEMFKDIDKKATETEKKHENLFTFLSKISEKIPEPKTKMESYGTGLISERDIELMRKKTPVEETKEALMKQHKYWEATDDYYRAQKEKNEQVKKQLEDVGKTTEKTGDKFKKATEDIGKTIKENLITPLDVADSALEKLLGEINSWTRGIFHGFGENEIIKALTNVGKTKMVVEHTGSIYIEGLGNLSEDQKRELGQAIIEYFKKNVGNPVGGVLS